MLQAAAQRLHHPSSPSPSPAAAAAPAPTPPPDVADRDSEQRSARRLSRISPADFDSVLANTDTVRIRSREPNQAAVQADEGSSRDLANQDPAMVNANTAPAVGGMAAGDGRTANSNAADSAAPPSSATGSLDDDNARSRIPTAEGTARRGSDTTHYDSLVAVGAIDSPRKPRSRHGSAATAESAPVVTVRFPPPDVVAGRPNLASAASRASTSNTTLAGAFGFSPRKPRVQSGETVQQDKYERGFAGTMRRTSRFFRRFGAQTAELDAPKTEPTLSLGPRAVPASGPSNAPSVASLPPPVPPLPLGDHVTPEPPARPSTPPPKSRLVPDELLLRTPSPKQSPSKRDRPRDAAPATRTTPQFFPSPSTRRRRSASMSSLERLDTRTTASETTDASPSSTRARPPRSEADRLRRELRKWQSAIDGVMDGMMDETPEAVIALDPDPDVSRGLIPEATDRSVPSSVKSSPALAAASPGARSGANFAKAVANDTFPTTSRSQTGAPEIRLHTPVVQSHPESQTQRDPDATAGLLGDPLVLDDTRRNPAPADEHSPSESLQEFLERTDPTPPRSPSRASSPFARADAVYGNQSSKQNKGSRSSIVGLSSPASVGTPSTPRPSSRIARSAELRALDALGDPELDAKAQEIAQQLWDGDESFIESREAAEWLGAASRISSATLRHYMSKFDFAGLRLDGARLCGRLYLKAETQQVDRILEQFSRWYYEQNPKSPYGSLDVVHAVTYSILLLNTDLHVVDSNSRMTRQQFVRNTLEAVRAQADSVETTATPGLLFGPDKVSAEPTGLHSDASSVFGNREAGASRASLDQSSRHRKSLAERAPEDSPSSSSLNLPASPAMSRSTTTTSARASDTPIRASLRSDSALTEMYSAVKAKPIYQLSGGSGSLLNLPEGGHSSASLVPNSSPYATWSPNLQRRTSHRSSRSTISGVATSNAYKRASVRGLGALLGASSLELVRSASPTPSTTTSTSDEHWGSASGAAAILQRGTAGSIGFASNLAHTIIKEQQEEDARSEASLDEVTDEELALLGAPWAKEGLLERKHFWETTGKRSKDKAWTRVFVVVSAGQLRMFRFGANGGGPGSSSRGAMGGGDWTTTASDLGSLSLVHALTSALPPPGYSRSRPHCFVFTLPDGGSYFFQAGTPDLVAEWVSTCNYWSARLSREPLAGGISNMEYGWNRVADITSLDLADDRVERTSIRSGHSRRSFASTAFRHAASSLTEHDRMHIHEWKPPQTPLAPSQLSEDHQVEALKRYLTVLQKEIAHHDALKGPMTRLYSPRSSNATKALANWTRKAQHLNAERVKYETYVEALSSAIKLRALHNGKKEVERMLANADEADPDDHLSTVGSRSPQVPPPASLETPAPVSASVHPIGELA
ncbi:hypothetical protein B0A53_01226 [Rhodotorula sp. CCFEE 5036]|nr:hypothetical protein B0A53_01226 [Rhodotorula sp. CCFEE 5036]